MQRIFILLLGAFLLAPQTALAEFKFCNDANEKIWTAIAHNEGGEWKSEGWWSMEPGECKRPIGADLTNRIYYFYAEGTDLDFIEGDYAFCTDRNDAFDIIGNDIQDNCADNGYTKTLFHGVELTDESEVLVTLKKSGGNGVFQIKTVVTQQDQTPLSNSEYMSLLQGKWETEASEITVTGDRYFEFGSGLFGFFEFTGDIEVSSSCPYKDEPGTYVVRSDDSDSELTYCDEITFANKERFVFINRFLESEEVWYRME